MWLYFVCGLGAQWRMWHKPCSFCLLAQHAHRRPPQPCTMPMSVHQRSKRAFVQVILSLAAAYGLVTQVNRDSDDEAIKAAYRRVVRRVHPDKGGSVADAQRLQAVKDEWDATRKTSKQRGRPARRDQGQAAASTLEAHALHSPSAGALANISMEQPEQGPGFCFQATGVMFTYQGICDHAQWARFQSFVTSQLAAWQVAHWCATLEKTAAGRLHVHLYVQFRLSAKRTSRKYTFEGINPHVSASDYCGEGHCRKRLQNSIDRGMFYCWADKIGTERDAAGNPCVAGNYMPAWTTALKKYAVAGRWVDNLWKRHMLTHAVYEEYIFLARDGVVSRKRNLDACRQREEEASGAREIAERVQRIRSNSAIYRTFPEIAVVTEWQRLFREDALRYPILIVHGPSYSGKTEYANSLFPDCLELKVGALGHFPDGMRAFQRNMHGAIVLDDVRDMAFLVQSQDKLQGKYNCLVEFASTPGGQCAYAKDLFRTPIIVTVNNSTANLQLLATDDWLGNARNRVVVTYPPA